MSLARFLYYAINKYVNNCVSDFLPIHLSILVFRMTRLLSANAVLILLFPAIVAFAQPTGAPMAQAKTSAKPAATPVTKPVAAKPVVQDPYEKEYQRRIKLKEINGVYIPKDLFDAFAQLDKLIDDEGLAKFKAHTEEECVRKLHFSLGRWIWLNWGLMEGSRLSVFFGDYGIRHAEDISNIIIRSYHRKVNNKDIAFKAQIDELHGQYDQEDEAKRAKIAAKIEAETGKKVIVKDKNSIKKPIDVTPQVPVQEQIIVAPTTAPTQPTVKNKAPKSVKHR